MNLNPHHAHHAHNAHYAHHAHPQVALKPPTSSKSGNVLDLFKSFGLLRSTLIM